MIVSQYDLGTKVLCIMRHEATLSVFHMSTFPVGSLLVVLVEFYALIIYEKFRRIRMRHCD